MFSTTPNLAARVDIQRVFADPWSVPTPVTKRTFPVASSDVQSKSHSAPRTMLDRGFRYAQMASTANVGSVVTVVVSWHTPSQVGSTQRRMREPKAGWKPRIWSGTAYSWRVKGSGWA